MTYSGVVTSARVTHETADVDELAAASPESQHAAVGGLLTAPDVSEALVLATCNRVEAYVVAPSATAGRDALSTFFGDAPASVVVDADHEESLRHLLRVACGLESVVLGEDQIIGQVRDAYDDARRCGGIGDVLETAVVKAIHVGERARTETAINEGIVSLGSAAAEVADETVALDGADALVVGAGEMGRLAARALDGSGASSVSVANRTLERAERLCEDLETVGEAVPLGELEAAAAEADVVVTATGSPEPVLDPDHLGEHEQVLVDLGQPRDIDPATAALPSVTVYDLDDLESITRETHEERASAAEEVEAVIDSEFEHLLEQYKRRRADEAIAAMYESAERVKERELETAYARLTDGDSFTDEQREIVDAMADALVGQLLAAPTKSLREAAVEDDLETIETALQLFDPEFGPRLPSVASVEGDAGSTVGTAEDD